MEVGVSTFFFWHWALHLLRPALAANILSDNLEHGYITSGMSFTKQYQGDAGGGMLQIHVRHASPVIYS